MQKKGYELPVQVRPFKGEKTQPTSYKKTTFEDFIIKGDPDRQLTTFQHILNQGDGESDLYYITDPYMES